MKAREYLVSKGLAKPGRGKFSKAAKEALEAAVAAGQKFDDYADGKVTPKVVIKAKTPEERAAINARKLKESQEKSAQINEKRAGGSDVLEPAEPIYGDNVKFFAYVNGKKTYTSNRNTCFHTGVSVQYCPCGSHQVIVGNGGYIPVQVEQ